MEHFAKGVYRIIIRNPPSREERSGAADALHNIPDCRFAVLPVVWSSFELAEIDVFPVFWSTFGQNRCISRVLEHFLSRASMSRPTQYGGGDGVLVEWGTGLAHPAENREEINEGIAIGEAYNKVFEPKHPVYNGCGLSCRGPHPIM